MNNINEGPTLGAESAAAYKAATPGQEDANNIPYKNEDEIVNDDIKKMIAAVSSRIMCMGLKESVRKFGTDWGTISKFLATYEEDGIDKLVEHLASLNEITGKPLRAIVEEVDLDEVENLSDIRKSNKFDSDVGKKRWHDKPDKDEKIGKLKGHDEETHGNSDSSDKDEREISRMKLVASHNKKNIKESVNPDELIDDNPELDEAFNKAVKE